MGGFKNILLIGLCLAVSTSCTKPNVLTDMSQQDTDEAYYIAAQQQIDNSQWDAAINIIENKMSVGYQARRDVINMHAGAYAGKCGINFFGLVNGLKGAAGGASQIFPYFMSAFSGVTVSPDACEQAVILMQSIGAVGVRTADENLFLAVLGIARIATNLAAKIDTDHNGAMDSSSDLCHEWTTGSASHPWLNTDPAYVLYPPPVAPPSHYVKDSEVQRMAAGIGLIAENVTALSDIIGSSNSVITAVASLNAQCTAVGIACDKTDPTAVTNPVIYGIRTLLNSSSLGFGSCVPGSVAAGQICCPTLKPPPAAPAAWP